MGYDAMGPGLAGAAKEMVMSEVDRSVTQEERELAKAIFTAAAAIAVANNHSPDLAGLAERAFNAAEAFSNSSASRPKPRGVMDYL